MFPKHIVPCSDPHSEDDSNFFTSIPRWKMKEFWNYAGQKFKEIMSMWACVWLCFRVCSPPLFDNICYRANVSVTWWFGKRERYNKCQTKQCCFGCIWLNIFFNSVQKIKQIGVLDPFPASNVKKCVYRRPEIEFIQIVES